MDTERRQTIVGTCNWCGHWITSDQAWAEYFTQATDTVITGYHYVTRYHRGQCPTYHMARYRRQRLTGVSQ